MLLEFLSISRDFYPIMPNFRRYAQLPLQRAFVSGYQKDSQMNQH
jgi:hypothetical protein